MGRSLSEMNSGAEGAKNVTGFEGIAKPAVERPELSSGGTPKPAAGPSKEEVLQRFIDETPKTGGGSRRGFATEVGPARKSTIPTARMGTVKEGERRASTREVSVPFHEMHTTYSNIINTARNFRSNSKSPLSPDHHDALDVATTHLMNSIVSYHRARSEGGLGTRDMHNPTAHAHLYDAVKHLAAAHETLVQSGVHESMRSRRLPHSLPQDSAVADLAAKASTLEGQGVGGVQGKKKPYKKGFIGRGGEMELNNDVLTIKHPDHPNQTLEIPMKDMHHLGTTFGKHHPAVQKMYAMAGEQRGKQLRITPEERREGVVRSVAAGVAEGAPAGRNPKSRGSGRRVDVRFRSDANRLGQTPRPGEGGRSGTLKGDVLPVPARAEGVKKGIEQQTPNPQARAASEEVRMIPSGKPGPGKLAKRMAGTKRRKGKKTGN